MSKGAIIAVLVIPVLLVGAFSAYQLNLYPGNQTANIFSSLPSLLRSDEVTVTYGDITKETRFTGEIFDAAEVDVFFETEGKVESVLVSPGDIVNKDDVLARIEADSLFYRFKSAEAQLRAAESRLHASRSGTRSEEISVKQANVARYLAQVESYSGILQEEYQNAFAVAQTAILSQTDQLFNDPRKSNRRIIGLPIGNYEPEEKRGEIGVMLATWQEETKDSATREITELATQAQENLTKIRSYLTMLSYIFNHPDNYSDTYASLISTALASTNESLLSLSRTLEGYESAANTLSVAKQELNLSLSGERDETIANDAAMADYYRNQYEEVRYEYEKTVLKAPVGGAIAKRDLEVGQRVTDNTPAFTIVGTGTPYTIKADVSELMIADIALGIPALVTIDALPGTTLSAQVTDIDLSDTTINDVPTYQVTLSFTESLPETIRPGMTANVVTTTTRSNVLTIPLSFVSVRGTQTVVNVLKRGSTEERNVILGSYGGNGTIEVLSGLSEGETLIKTP